MKNRNFFRLLSQVCLALAAALLVSLASCNKESKENKKNNDNNKPTLPGITITTEKAVNDVIELRFGLDDKLEVVGAGETESSKDDGWLKKTYKLTAQTLVIKGTVAKLDCHGNVLTVLDVSKNTKLWELFCHGNKLSSLDVKNNTMITRLDCSENALESLDVSKNTKLWGLSCHGNKLSSLDVKNNIKLTDLRCSNNKLSSLDVSKNTKLWGLSCHGNKLKSLDVSNNTLIMWIDCSINKLSYKEIKLPDLKGKEYNGDLYFKDANKNDTQKLTKAEVDKIKSKNWRVLQKKGEAWNDYPGE